MTSGFGAASEYFSECQKLVQVTGWERNETKRKGREIEGGLERVREDKECG